MTYIMLTRSVTPDSFLALPDTADDFRIVWIPDTQFYTRDNTSYFADQTAWIAANATALNIKMVLHEGDLVDDEADADQWTRALTAMTTLDTAHIPNLICMGNHDYYNRLYTHFLAAWPATWYTAQAWFNGGVYVNQANVYTLMTIGQYGYVFIAIEHNPRSAVLDWLETILAANPTRTAIIVTHANLEISNQRGSEGAALWERVKNYSNVLMIGNGHDVGGADYYGQRVNWVGHSWKVLQFMVDWQNGPNGGNGYLRITHFKPNSRAVLHQTYSPSLNAYDTSAQAYFAQVY